MTLIKKYIKITKTSISAIAAKDIP